MTDYQLDPNYAIADEQALRTHYRAVHTLAALKCMPALDKHARAFIERAPFLCIGTQGAEGKADVSPRGDPAGFVRILDDRTIAIPDRPGNNRLDTLTNILANPEVGLIFIIPGFDDTLRINGQASLTRDPKLLALMAVNERAPATAIVIRVREVYMHCAKAFRRSHLWDPAHFRDRSELPTLSKIVLDQTTGAPDDAEEMKKLDQALEEDYRASMY